MFILFFSNNCLIFTLQWPHLLCLDQSRCSPALLGRLEGRGRESLPREYQNDPLSQSCGRQRVRTRERESEREREHKSHKHPEHDSRKTKVILHNRELVLELKLGSEVFGQCQFLIILLPFTTTIELTPNNWDGIQAQTPSFNSRGFTKIWHLQNYSHFMQSMIYFPGCKSIWTTD